jgi:hypothetical protein
VEMKTEFVNLFSGRKNPKKKIKREEYEKKYFQIIPQHHSLSDHYEMWKKPPAN